MRSTDNCTDIVSKEESSEVFEWFWELIEEMNSEERSKVLHFATGSSRLPSGGFAELDPKFEMHIIPGTPDHLPIAHTCFNRIDLYTYISKEQLNEKLQSALEAGEGFQFV